MTAIHMDLPPALFDLPELEEQPTTEITRRHGHTIRVHNTPTGQVIYCTCSHHSPVRATPDQVTKWAYDHLGIAYDTAINRAVHA